MRRRTLALLAVIAALLVVLLVVRSTRDGRALEISVPADPFASSEPTETRFDDPESATGARALAAPEPAPVAEVQPPRDFTGIVVLVGLDGRRARVESGIVEWKATDPASQAPVRTTRVERWQWSIDRGEAASLTPARVRTFDGRLARCRPVEKAMDAGVENQIVADVERALVLEVLDAETRKPLEDVSIYTALGAKEGTTDTRVPPNSITDRSPEVRGSSPLPVPSIEVGAEVGWAIAPGYAWERFTFTGDVGKRTLLLERGSTLRINVEGRDRFPHPLAVRVREPHGASVCIADRLLAAPGTMLVPGLPSGVVVATVEQRGALVNGTRLAMQTVEIVAGKEARADFALDGSRRMGVGRLRILPARVGFGDGWDRVREVRLRRIDDEHGVASFVSVPPPSADSPASTDRELLVEGLAPGTYLVLLTSRAQGTTVEIFADRETVWQVPSGDAAELVVTVLDERGSALTSATVVVRAVGWTAHKLQAEVEANPRTKTYRVRSDAIPVELTIAASRRRPLRFVHELQPGEHELTVTLERADTVRVRVRATEGGVPVALPNEWWCTETTVTNTSTDGHCLEIGSDGPMRPATLSTFDHDSAYFVVEAPGRYVMRWRTPRGFAPIEERTIDVVPGIDAAIELALVPQ